MSEQEKFKKALITVIKDLEEPIKEFCKEVSNSFDDCIYNIYVSAKARNHYPNVVAKKLLAKLYAYISNRCDKYPDNSSERDVCNYIADKIVILKYIVGKMAHINYHRDNLEDIASEFAEDKIMITKMDEVSNK